MQVLIKLSAFNGVVVGSSPTLALICWVAQFGRAPKHFKERSCLYGVVGGSWQTHWFMSLVLPKAVTAIFLDWAPGIGSSNLSLLPTKIKFDIFIKKCYNIYRK